MMEIYALFDKEGLPKGFYNRNLHKGKIPKQAIKISEEHWSEFINNQGQRRWNGNYPEPYNPPDKRDYSDKRKDEYPDIRGQLDAIMKWIAGENEITVTPELKSIAMKCMSVKAKYPKPKEE